MSAAQAKTIGVDLSGTGDFVSVFDLVKENPVDALDDGTTGWFFLLDMSAVRVPWGGESE